VGAEQQAQTYKNKIKLVKYKDTSYYRI